MRNSLLAAMALCGATMSTMPLWAATEWEDPTLPTVAIDLESEGIYYVYHPATKLFMANGNAQNNWGTEVVLSDKGQRVRVRTATDNREAGTVTGWTLEMLDATANNGGKPKYLWTNSTILCVDYNLQVEGSYVWKITKNADSDTYRIRIPEEDPRYGESAQDGIYKDCYMGWDGQINEDGTMVNHTVWPLANKETAGYEKAEFDWAFVKEDDYKAYEAKFELKTALEYAVAKGYQDYAEYEEIYNGNGTAEEIKAAAEALTKEVDDFLIGNASEDNPMDLTNRISSPSFDNGTTGWTTQRDSQSGQDNFGMQSAEKPTTDGKATFANFFERWVAQPPQSNWSILQEVKDLPQGKYKLSAYVLTNNDAPEGAYLVADGGAGEERQAIDQPGNVNGTPTAAPYEVEFTVINNSATIGLRVIGANFQWLGVDNFKLTYYGKSDSFAKDGLQATINEAEAYLAEIADAKCSAAGKEKFEADLKLAQDGLANDELSDDSLVSLRLILIHRMDTMKNDVQAYSELMPIIDDKLATLIDNYEPYAELSDNPEAFVNIYDCTDALEDSYNNGTFDPLYIDSVATKIDEAFRKDIFEMVNNGLTGDLYGLLQSPNFDNNSSTGWNGGPGIEAGVAEKYFGNAGAQSFDVYQEIENIPNGVYTISMQGFSRPGNNDELQAGWGDGVTNTVYAQLYGNDNAVALQHLYNGGRTEPYATKDDGSTDDRQVTVDGETKYVVNNRTNAAIAFEAGEYKNEVRCVVFDGKLRFGVKMNAEAGLAGSWNTFDNFRVNYVGEATAADYVASVQLLYNEANVLYSAITSYEKTATADVVAQLGELLTKASAFISSPTTTEEAETIIADMKEAIEYANTSVERTAELNTLVDDMYNNRCPNYEQTPGFEGIDFSPVYDLCDEISLLLPTNEIESVEKVDEYTVQLNSLLTKAVQDVAGVGATKDDPKDLTSLIINPGFSLTDTESGLTTDTGEGWTTNRDGGDMNFRISAGEFYNNKSFDIHQTLYGLAPGFYRLSCNAFYRDGGYEIAAGKHRRGVEDLNAMLYAGPEDAWTYTPIMSIIEDGQSEPTASQNVNVADSLTTEDNPIEAWYIPNAMEDAGPAFSKNLYYNELNFEVKEGQVINIGIRKEQQTEANDWTIFDTFQLFYYGNGEENRPDGVQDIEEGVARVVRSTYYTIDGAQIAKPTQRGLYIRKDELSDGTVKTGKILVK